VAVVGVDVGGTKIAAAVVGADLGVRAVARVPTPRGADALVEAVARTAASLVRSSTEPVTGVGLGIASLVDAAGRVVSSTNIDLQDRDIAGELSRRLGLPVAIDNDANVAALAEARAGAGAGYGLSVTLTIGTGIGGGIVVDGRLFRGGNGTGAELGHVVVQADGPPCQGRCPSRGCLETMASGTAIARDAAAAAAASPEGALAAAAASGRPLTAELVAALAREGDPEAVAILARAGRFLGTGLASLANVLNPDVFVIGGGVGAVGDLILDPARDEYRSRALPPNARAPVVLARLGPDAGIVGAAILALELPS
jgi:glucokinase